MFRFTPYSIYTYTCDDHIHNNINNVFIDMGYIYNFNDCANVLINSQKHLYAKKIIAIKKVQIMIIIVTEYCDDACACKKAYMK